MDWISKLRIWFGARRQQMMTGASEGYLSIRLSYQLARATRLLKDISLRPVFMDIGARGGLNPPWAYLVRKGVATGVAVELDSEESARLKAELPGLICLPVALGSEHATRTLHVTASSGCTSFLKPNFDVLNNFAVKAWFEVVETIDLPMVKFGDLVKAGSAPAATFLKMDVQGFEKEVLLGFGESLNDLLAIEMEGHFRPIYHGEWSADEMIDAMSHWGFILRDIRGQGPFEGELLEANFYFSRRAKDITPERQKLLRVWEAIERIPIPKSFQTLSKNTTST